MSLVVPSPSLTTSTVVSVLWVSRWRTLAIIAALLVSTLGWCSLVWLWLPVRWRLSVGLPRWRSAIGWGLAVLTGWGRRAIGWGLAVLTRWRWRAIRWGLAVLSWWWWPWRLAVLTRWRGTVTTLRWWGLSVARTLALVTTLSRRCLVSTLGRRGLVTTLGRGGLVTTRLLRRSCLVPARLLHRSGLITRTWRFRWCSLVWCSCRCSPTLDRGCWWWARGRGG